MDVEYQISPVKTLSQVFTATNTASQEDYTICRQIMLGASKNYSFASKYLPPDKLPHVEALYALMRVGDDRVDVNHEGFDTALQAIDSWETTYQLAFKRGDSPDPVMRAYLDTAYKFGIPEETMEPYFRAMREDLTIKRFPTFDDLLHYIDGSAIPVGRAMTHILGVKPAYSLEEALNGADALSIAMQLSNFWRDIGEDWGIGRIYIPQADMERFQYQEKDLADGLVNENFIRLLEYEIERTERYYRIAQPTVKMLESGNWAVMSALEIYRAILTSIRSNKYDVFSQRAGAATIDKIRLVLKSSLHTRLSTP